MNAGRNKTKPKCLRLKEKKSISFYKTVQTGLIHSFNCPIKYGP